MGRKGLMTQRTYRRRAMVIVVVCGILLVAIPLAGPSILESIIGLR
jgi:hypothetical protein